MRDLAIYRCRYPPRKGEVRMMKFVKMQGLGNDYVFIDALVEPAPADPAQLSRIMSCRHTGVGSDGLMLIEAGRAGRFRMRAFNADGSEAEMCGNAIRCVGKYLYECGYIDEERVEIETLAGIRRLRLHVNDGRVDAVEVDMGVPSFDPAAIPVLAAADEAGRLLLACEGGAWFFTCLSLGNPHAVAFVDAYPDLALVGPALECHPRFPERANIHFVRVLAADHLEMRVWERGSGITQACGTGACAVLAAAVERGLCARKATVSLPGGDLRIEWREEDRHLLMTGPAVIVFRGEWIEDGRK